MYTVPHRRKGCVCLCVLFYCGLKINRPASADCSQHSRPRSYGRGHLLGLTWPFIIHCQHQQSTARGQGAGVSSRDAPGNRATLSANTRMSDNQISILSGLLLSTAMWTLWCYRCCQTERLCGSTVSSAAVGQSIHLVTCGEFSELRGFELLRSSPCGD